MAFIDLVVGFESQDRRRRRERQFDMILLRNEVNQADMGTTRLQ